MLEAALEFSTSTSISDIFRKYIPRLQYSHIEELFISKRALQKLKMTFSKHQRVAEINGKKFGPEKIKINGSIKIRYISFHEPL